MGLQRCVFPSHAVGLGCGRSSWEAKEADVASRPRVGMTAHVPEQLRSDAWQAQENQAGPRGGGGGWGSPRTKALAAKLG